MTNDIDIYRGGRALQLKDITSELEDFAMSTHMWEGFFKADGNLGMHNVFCSEYLDWIQSNKRNDILGIDHFHHISMTAGTSEAFQMFMMRHNKQAAFTMLSVLQISLALIQIIYFNIVEG